GLHPRVDRDAVGEAGGGLPARDAHIPGTRQRGRTDAAHRVHPRAQGSGGVGRRRRSGRAQGAAGQDAAGAKPMTTESPQLPGDHYLNDGYGWKSWLFTTDHKRIALLYLASVSVMFLLGGLFASLIRLELLTPAGDVVQAETYNKLFTMHGVLMVFFFLIPAIPAVLGNFL